MADRWRDDDRFRFRDDRDREQDQNWDRLRDDREHQRRFGSLGETYAQRDPYGREPNPREQRSFGAEYERGGQDQRERYGRDEGYGRDFDRERRFEGERRFAGDRDYQRHQGWRGDDQHPGYARNEYRPRERSAWERGRDEVSSWFGDEEATRRRQQDERRDRERHPEHYAGRDEMGREADYGRGRPDWRGSDRDLNRDRGRDRDRPERERGGLWGHSDEQRRDRDRDEDRWRRDAGDRWQRDWRGSNRDW